MKPLASLSLDLDNLWAYQMTHGDEGWDDYGSYLTRSCRSCWTSWPPNGCGSRSSWWARTRRWTATRSPSAALADAGHEIGNHSFRHQPWLHRYTPDEIHDELRRAEDAIEAVTGRRTVGFRGPGYSLSADVLRVLVDRGYRYDCSTLPTVIGPLARKYYFRSAQLSRRAARRAGVPLRRLPRRSAAAEALPVGRSAPTACSRSRSPPCRGPASRCT